MGTATLRAGLIVAAVILSLFVLTKAFPNDTAADVTEPTPNQTVSPPPASPPPDEEPPPAEDVPDRVAKVTVQVLNGTDETGLAASVAQDLNRIGYKVDPDDTEAVANSRRPYDRTTIFFRKDSRLEAAALRDAIFQRATLERRAGNLSGDFRVTIVLGADFNREQAG